MLKIYAKRQDEKELAYFLLDKFKSEDIPVRIVTSFPIEGFTRKVKGSNEHVLTRDKEKVIKF